MLSKTATNLRFPCECVSARGGYSDPWAEVSQSKLLSDGTKEKLLNAVAQESKTIAQLAADLGLSQPTIHSHVTDLLASELLRESKRPEKRYATERYYEPNFPVVGAAEGVQFDAICDSIAVRIAELFARDMPQLERAFEKTALASRGWTLGDVAHYCYAGAQRAARRRLEERGILPHRKKHANGASWVFWAEEPRSEGEA